MNRRVLFCVLTCLMLSSAARVAAQYTGGNADGFDSRILIRSSCPAILEDVAYNGGNGDGFATVTLTQSTCSPVNLDINYTGGNGDGFDAQVLTQSTCSPINLNINYTGGNGDGFDAQVLTQSTCSPINLDINYTGGNGDGFDAQILTQSSCSPIIMDVNYTGGPGEGFDSKTLTQSSCAAILADVNYFGGMRSGFHWNIALRSPCAGINPLPVELLSFKAYCEEKDVILKWATGSESNNDYFTISRSTDNINYTDLGRVDGAGNSNQTLNYTFRDTIPHAGVTYYRLMQTDLDGAFEYHDVITVDCSDGFAGELVVYPNPTSGDLNIKIEDKGQPLNLQVFNVQGELVYSGIFTDRMTLQTENFAAGVYLIKAEATSPDSASRYLLKRFVKQ